MDPTRLHRSFLNIHANKLVRLLCAHLLAVVVPSRSLHIVILINPNKLPQCEKIVYLAQPRD
jgi:hypothetical protein